MKRSVAARVCARSAKDSALPQTRFSSSGIGVGTLRPPRRVPLRKHLHWPLAICAWRGRKVPTPIPLDENRVCGKAESFADLAQTREATLRFIESTRGTDVTRYRFEHPFLGNLHMRQSFFVIGYHELRHAKQIRELVAIFHS